jgi:hypothetical protein
MPAETTAPSVSLLSLISQDSLFAFLEGLTNIQSYSGWRSSATTGEGEALNYVASILGDLTYLQDSGMELERQSFHVFLATELWENRLYLTTAGQEREVRQMPREAIATIWSRLFVSTPMDTSTTRNEIRWRSPLKSC